MSAVLMLPRRYPLRRFGGRGFHGPAGGTELGGGGPAYGSNMLAGMAASNWAAFNADESGTAPEYILTSNSSGGWNYAEQNTGNLTNGVTYRVDGELKPVTGNSLPGLCVRIVRSGAYIATFDLSTGFGAYNAFNFNITGNGSPVTVEIRNGLSNGSWGGNGAIGMFKNIQVRQVL